MSRGPLAVVSESPWFSGHLASYPHLETTDRSKLEQAIRHHFHFDGSATQPQDCTCHPCDGTVHFRQMLSALLEKDPKYFRALLDRLRAERVPLLVICETLIVPVAEELGRMWCEDEESFSSVTAASSRLQLLLTSLSESDGPSFCDSERPRILLMRMPSNDHTLGLSVIASVFHEEGWSVDGGPSLTAGNRAYAMARDGGYKVIGVSVTVGSSTASIAAIIRKIRAACPDPETAILIGGPSLASRQEELRAAGADILATDVRQAIQAANALVKQDD
ncbi:cobalamin B12-binding domain-containing protein [Hoeflea olei]|uniref:B12-binding domain-containing protein n=1 Tax=Hoeflea olei TaxID=1480615 RepID=A0A1C1YYM0_9HYPH|nr:cobalamin-dependent protein [Hoeflea olei]OCW58509.1 hypothetical protein AWJ14_18620 [Hoeflea olei]